MTQGSNSEDDEPTLEELQRRLAALQSDDYVNDNNIPELVALEARLAALRGPAPAPVNNDNVNNDNVNDDMSDF